MSADAEVDIAVEEKVDIQINRQETPGRITTPPAREKMKHEPDGSVFYIVGDKFKDFSDTNLTISYSEAIDHIKIIAQIAKALV